MLTHEEERNKLMIGFLLIFLVVLTFIMGLSIVIREDRTHNFENQINILEIKNRELTQACELSDTLRQIIPPQAWDELQVVAEELRQRKTKIK